MVSSQKVLIVEPNPGGHRLNYVRLFATAAQQAGADVTLALPQDVDGTPEFKGHLADISDHLKQIVIEGEGRLGLLCWLDGQIRSGVYSDVLIPYGDGGLGETLSVFETLMRWKSSRRARVSLLKMRGTFAYENRGLRRKMQNYASLRALTSTVIHRVYWIDAIAFEHVQKNCKALARKSVFLPDPVCRGQMLSCFAAVDALKLPSGCRYIGLFGAIDERKGADRLIDAFFAAELPVQWKLLLAGRFSAAIRKKVFEQGDGSDQIIALDRFIDNSELQTYFEACDFVCVPFRRHIGSSSTVIRAAAANRPVLADSFGWIGEITDRYHLGLVCDAGNRDEFASAIRNFANSSQSWSPTLLHKQFVDLHSEPNFLAVLSRDLKEMHEAAPSRPY